MGDRFLLHRGVHRHGFCRLHAQRPTAVCCGQRFLQQSFQRLLAHPMAKVRHARTLQRKRMLKIFLTAKILHVRIALPALAHRFIRQPLDMLQQMQPHHQPDRQPWSPGRAVVRRKMRFQPGPIDQTTQSHQFMAQVDDVFQLRSEQFFHSTVLRFHSPVSSVPPKIKLQDFSVPHAKTLQFLSWKIQ